MAGGQEGFTGVPNPDEGKRERTRLWPGYRWSRPAHTWDRLFVVVLAVFFLLLLVEQLRQLSLFAWRAWQGGAWIHLGLSAVAMAAVGGFAYGNAVWLFHRWGSLRMFEQSLSAPRRSGPFTSWTDRIVLLVPSYREDPEGVRQTLLSAALQTYPHLAIVLLLDDPEPEALALFEETVSGVRELLRGVGEGPGGRGIEPIRQERDRLFHSAVAENRDFARTILDPWIAFWDGTPDGAEAARRLAAIGDRRIRVFARKRYSNLTRRPTKAMNLNAFLSLIGGRWREETRSGELRLVPAAAGEAALWELEEPEFVSVLDADTLLRFDYMDEMIEALHEPGRERAGAAFVMARPNPARRSRLHLAACIQTDLMAASLHYGGVWFDAAYWSGNNGLLRWQALQQIARKGEGVSVFIPDLPSEDTVCSVWMLDKGWQIKGIVAPTVYTEVPDTFAKLLIQRQRWTSSGYHGVPGVLRHWSRHWLRPSAWLELAIRFAYLMAIGPVSCVVLLAILTMMPVEMGAQLAWYCCLLYYVSVCIDLVRIGQPWHAVWRITALNLALLPVAVLSVISIASDLITGRKLTFHRTPRAGESISLSLPYRVVAACMVAGILWRTATIRLESVSGTFFVVLNLGLLIAGWHMVQERVAEE